MERLTNYRTTDNVVELMIGKLGRLPPETQNALQQFACMGNSAEFVVAVWHARNVPVGEVRERRIGIRMVRVAGWDGSEHTKRQRAVVEADPEGRVDVRRASLQKSRSNGDAVAPSRRSRFWRRNRGLWQAIHETDVKQRGKAQCGKLGRVEELFVSDIVDDRDR